MSEETLLWLMPTCILVLEAWMSKRLSYRVDHLETLMTERINSQNVTLDAYHRILDGRLNALEAAVHGTNEKEEG